MRMTDPRFPEIISSWDMAALDVPLLLEAHAYWLDKRGDRPVPLRKDIEPTEIPRLLPNLFLVEILEQAPPMRFRIRLIGTAFRRFFPADLTGLEISEESFGTDGARFCAEWREVLERRQPRWARIRQKVGRDGIAEIGFTGLVMPLSRDGTATDMLFGITLYDPLPGQARP